MNRASNAYRDCVIVVTEGKYFFRPYGWPFPKFSPFLDIFNFYISEFMEKGQWNAITNKYKALPQVCPDMSGSPIEFPNCIAAFIVLVCGSILAFLLFCFEFAMKPFDHKLDPIRRKFGDHSAGDDDEEDSDPIKAMDREQLELTINKQRDAIHHMKMELAMYQKTSAQEQFFQNTNKPGFE